MNNCVIDEIVGTLKRLIWDVRDLRDDVRHNDKLQHFIEKMSSLDDFQRILVVYGLQKDDPRYKLCMVGSKALSGKKLHKYNKLKMQYDAMRFSTPRDILIKDELEHANKHLS